MDYFFGFPVWCEYLEGCFSGSPNINNINDIWLILAALLEIVIRLGAIVAVGLIIYNGARMMVSQGSPDRVAAARDGILKATVGLVITLLSANLVALVASAFKSNITDNGIPVVLPVPTTVQIVLQYVFAIIGALSVLIVIVGGIRYIVSAGDPQRINTSKNTILYAIIGLTISVSAYFITGFIFRVIGGNL